MIAPMRKLIPEKFKREFLKVCLFPVAKFCLRQSLKLQDLQQALKEVLVEAAASSLEEEGIEPSASRITLLTGVHRKDVSAIQAGGKKSPSHTDLMTKVLGQWQEDRNFSIKGKPRPLTCVGKESEFAELVRAINKEINPYTVMFELERAGLVEKRGSLVLANAREFVPVGNSRQLFKMYELDGADLLSAIEENALGSDRTKHLHLRTAFDNIPISTLPSLREWIFSEGEKFHQRARAKLARYDRDTSKNKLPNEGTARIAVTMFDYSTEIKGHRKGDE